MQLELELADAFSRAQAHHPRFSLRAFAAQIGVPASTLSEVFSGKRMLTESATRKILANPWATQRLSGIKDIAEPYRNRDQPDTAPIEALLGRFVAHWNEHDSQGLCSFYNKECNLISPWGPTFVGRSDVRDFYESEHSEKLSDASIHILSKDISLVKSSVGIADIDFLIRGAKSHPRSRTAIPDIHFRTSLILKKSKNSRWEINSSRPHVLIDRSKPALPQIFRWIENESGAI